MRRAVLLVPLLILLAPALAGCLEPPPDPRPPFVGGDPRTEPDLNLTHATFETDKGTFVIAFAPEAAPKTVAHIQDLIEWGFYDGIPFHRYERGFVVQAGDLNCKERGLDDRSCGTGGSGATVPLESHPDHTHRYGAVGLARASAPDSGDSQLYVVLDRDGAHGLDGDYCVLGYIASGMDVVESLRRGDVIHRVTLSSGAP